MIVYVHRTLIEPGVRGWVAHTVLDARWGLFENPIGGDHPTLHEMLADPALQKHTAFVLEDDLEYAYEEYEVEQEKYCPHCGREDGTHLDGCVAGLNPPADDPAIMDIVGCDICGDAMCYRNHSEAV